MDQVTELFKNYEKQILNVESYLEFMEMTTDIPEEYFVKLLIEDIKKYDCSNDKLTDECGKVYNEKKLIELTKDSIDKLKDRRQKYLEFKNLAQINDTDGYNEVENCIPLPVGDVEDYINHNVDVLTADVDYDKAKEIAVEHVNDFIKNTYEMDNLITVDDYQVIKKHFDIVVKKDIQKVFEIYIDEIDYITHRIKEYNMLLQINDDENIVNNYRQSFILLVTILDAAVFDITEKLLKDKFFSFISKFTDGKEKIKYSEMGNYVDENDFFDHIISDVLKPKYIKELLIYYSEILDGEFKEMLPKFIEMINRRNVHLHNNGVVDTKYIEKYNLFNKSIGDILAIDKNYYHDSFNNIKYIIEVLIDFVRGEVS